MVSDLWSLVSEAISLDIHKSGASTAVSPEISMPLVTLRM